MDTPLLGARGKKAGTHNLRTACIARVQQQPTTQEITTLGSLYTPSGAFNDMSADYKARHLGDIVTLLVSETTAASSTGDVNNSRAFAANSAITNLPGTKSQAANPLLGMTSSKSLKGQGETST